MLHFILQTPFTAVRAPYRVFSRKLVVDSVFGGAEACVREEISSQNSISPNFPQTNWSGR